MRLHRCEVFSLVLQLLGIDRPQVFAHQTVRPTLLGLRSWLLCSWQFHLGFFLFQIRIPRPGQSSKSYCQHFPVEIINDRSVGHNEKESVPPCCFTCFMLHRQLILGKNNSHIKKKNNWVHFHSKKQLSRTPTKSESCQIRNYYKKHSTQMKAVAHFEFDCIYINHRE